MFIEFTFNILGIDNENSTLIIEYVPNNPPIPLDNITTKLQVETSILVDFLDSNITVEELKAAYREGIVIQSAIAQYKWNNKIRDSFVTIPTELTDLLSNQS